MAIETKVEAGKTITRTRAGKELRIKIAAQLPYWEVYFYPGGEVPTSLQGYWKTTALAERAIAAYLETK